MIEDFYFGLVMDGILSEPDAWFMSKCSERGRANLDKDERQRYDRINREMLKNIMLEEIAKSHNDSIELRLN